jgi:hypothetical protein
MSHNYTKQKFRVAPEVVTHMQWASSLITDERINCIDNKKKQIIYDCM